MAALTTTNPNINYDDPRFEKVNTEKNDALDQVDEAYGEMIGNSDKFYDGLIAESERWKDEQTALQKEQTDFTLQKIEQQKEQARKDYTKEQSGAYVDWQKQSNQYGANAEGMAAQGMAKTGYSESAQVAMYTAYQNRLASAREIFSQAVLNYDNNMKEAMLQNSAALAEIAHNAFVEQAQLALDGFQYKNQLVQEQFNKQMEVKKFYADEYQRVLDQINADRAFKENVRQFEQNYALQVKEYEEGIRQFNEEIARLKAKDAQEYAMEIQQLELQKQALAQEKEQADREYQLKLQEYNRTKITNTYKGDSTPKVTTGNAQTNQQRMVAEKENNVYDQYDIDYKSLNDAGYSQTISEATMAKLVDRGVLTYKIVGNKIVFSKNQDAPRNASNTGGISGTSKNLVDKFYAFK